MTEHRGTFCFQAKQVSLKYHVLNKTILDAKFMDYLALGLSNNTYY